MNVHVDAAPIAIPARPELTDGRRIGVLLQHGFTGSPHSMRPWADALGAQGYGIDAPRLPGHGTRWQDLNNTGWSDWYAETRRAFERLDAEHDVVIAGGLSMGGALVLRLAADLGDRVAGLMLVNPAVNTERKDVLALPVLKWIVPAFGGIASDIKKPDVTENGYDRTPLKAAHSMMQNWAMVRADLPKIDAPIIYFRSAEDHVVDDSSQRIIRAGVASTDYTEVSLPESYHVATLDNDAPLIFERSAEFIRKVASG